MKYNLNSVVTYGGGDYEVVGINTDGTYTLKSRSGEMTFNSIQASDLNLPLTLESVKQKLRRL